MGLFDTVVLYGVPFEHDNLIDEWIKPWRKTDVTVPASPVNDLVKKYNDIQKALKQDSHLTSYTVVMSEDGSTQIFSIDLPGVKKEDIELEVLDECIRVTSKRGDKKNVLDVIPDKNFDISSGQAELDLGVLTVKFTKRVVEKKTLTIK